MLKQKTVFIVGAGASCEVNFPSGNGLKTKIADLLNIKFGDFGRSQSSGDLHVTHAFRDIARMRDDLGGNINPLLHKSWQIVDNLPAAAISIDNYLDAHQGDELLEKCGKIGIVKAIIDAEAASPLRTDRETNQSFPISAIDGKWYQALFQQLSENLRRSDVSRMFENASFIIFNYDRCVEHVFSRLIASYYNIPDSEAQAVMNEVPIIHPYGVIGRLPWQPEDGSEPLVFGQVDRINLVKAAERIRTFTEGQDDPVLMKSLHMTIQQAHTVVFLGFSFGRQNLNLLAPDGSTVVRRVYGTSLGLTPEECEVIKLEVGNMIRQGWQQITPEPKLYSETCTDMLRRVGRALTA